MLNIAADHINAVEAKDAAERLAMREQTDREILINSLHQTIADAERRKVAPIFSSEDAAAIFGGMKANVERLATEYENRLWHTIHSGRGFRLELSSEQAIAYFFGNITVEKLPTLADKINSRDGRGHVLNEVKRAAVVAECDATIAEARARLSALGLQPQKGGGKSAPLEFQLQNSGEQNEFAAQNQKS